MMVENESLNIEKEIVKCCWCDQSDDLKKVYCSPGDDIENPKAYHEDCFKALQAFGILCWSYPDEPMEKLIKIANRIAGIKEYKKKNKK